MRMRRSVRPCMYVCMGVWVYRWMGGGWLVMVARVRVVCTYDEKENWRKGKSRKMCIWVAV